MIACDTCDEWYHFDCVGFDNDHSVKEDRWECGYCQGEQAVDGIQQWTRNIPQGLRKRVKTAPDRRIDETPKAKGIAIAGDEMVATGESTWFAIRAAAREGGKRINLKEKAAKGKAKGIVAAGGHHVVDHVVGGQVEPRPVNMALVDELAGNGILSDDEIDGDINPIV